MPWMARGVRSPAETLWVSVIWASGELGGTPRTGKSASLRESCVLCVLLICRSGDEGAMLASAAGDDW